MVIDNTNPSPQGRAEYIGIAQDANIPVRCFYFKTPLDVAQHMNQYRENIFGVKHGIQPSRPHQPLSKA